MTTHSQASPMSITQLCNSDEQLEHHRSSTSSSSSNDSIDYDRDAHFGTEGLGDMAQAKTAIPAAQVTLPPLSAYLSAPSTMPNSPLPTPSNSSLSRSRLSFSSESSLTTLDEDYTKQQPQHFMHRVSNLPIVNSALRAYENTKQTNGMMKYGVEMVESFAAPIYDKFGRRASTQYPELGERYVHLTRPAAEHEDEGTLAAATALARATLNDTNEQREGFRRRRADDARNEKMHGKQARSRSVSRSTSPHRPYSLTPKSPNVRHRPQPIPRSRWQQIVLHAGSAAGTTAAVISEESMKCLRYCLSWLQYATRHIEQQMGLLRNFLVALAAGNQSASNSPNSKAVADPSSASSTLVAIKKEIINTLRKVVDVVSKYAGAGLPEQAKASVRSFILALPSRWAALNTSATASPAASPALGPRTSPHLHETSLSLLSFGDESIEMLQSVSNVFSDTIDRAELWLDRLRVVGVAGTPSASSGQSSVSKTGDDTSVENQEPPTASINKSEIMDTSS